MVERASAEVERWKFGDFELDARDRTLVQGDRELPCAAKSLDILLYLVRRPERVVPWDELNSAVWPDVVVSESAVASAVRDLRRVLGDSAREPRFVATRRGYGLRFVHPIEVVRGADAAEPGSGWREAADALERAIEALELVAARRGTASGGMRERAELGVALARARWSAGSGDAARATFADAARFARDTQDPEILAQAALGFAGRTDVTPGVRQEAVALLREALAVLPEKDGALRAELLARLGTEVYFGDPDESDSLTRDGLAMAERVGDASVLAYALTARHFASQRPEIEARERMPLSLRALALVGEEPASDVAGLALQQRLVDLLELGEGAAFEADFARFRRVAAQLDQPFFLWLESMFIGMRALARGREDEAERAAVSTAELGRRFELANADGVFAAQLFGLRFAQRRLGELRAAMEAVAAQYPELPIYQAGLAATLAEDGAASDAREVIERVMADGLAAFPRDQNWVATLGLLGPAVATAGEEKRRRELLELLSPYAGRMIVVGQGAIVHGAVDHHIGLLEASLGRQASAEQALGRAVSLATRAGAPAWAARSRSALETCAIRGS